MVVVIEWGEANKRMILAPETKETVLMKWQTERNSE